MKLLIISEGYYPYNGGLEKIVTEVAEGLYKTGKYEITVITSTREVEDTHTEIINGIKVIYVPLGVSHGKKRFLFELLNARRILRREMKNKYEFVSIQYLGYLATVFASLKIDRKYMVSIHGMDVTGQQSKWVRVIQKKIIENALVVISNSHYLAHILEKKINYPIQTKLQVIWNGICLERYKATENLVKDKVIVSVGRFVYKKGFDILIKAFADVVKKYCDAKLIIAGDGPEKNKCEQLAEKLGVRGQIEFLGSVSNKDIASVFAQGKVFVCPSRNEPFGIVVLEALAMGIPVIATDSGGITEILGDGKYGCVVPKEDVEAIAEQIICMLNNDSELLKIREKGLERVKVFSMEHVVSAYDQVFQQHTLDADLEI